MSFNFLDLSADDQRIAAKGIVFEAGGDADDPLEVQMAIDASLAAGRPTTGADILARVKQCTDCSDMTLSEVLGVSRATMNLYTTRTRSIDLDDTDKHYLRHFIQDRSSRLRALLGAL